MADRQNAPQVTLARLFEKTSGNGNRYFFGRMVQSKIMLFFDARATEESDGTDPIWNLVVAPVDDEKPRQRSERAPRQERPRREEKARPPINPRHLEGEGLRKARVRATDWWQAPANGTAAMAQNGGDFLDDELPEDMR
jgi:hypothetical protein